MIGCIFCEIVKRKESAEIVYEDRLCLAFLDKYPQTRGHLQLIPKRHYKWIYEIPEMGEFFTIARHIIRVIIPVLGCHHVTLATFGREIEHAHLWIVPQYKQNQTLKEGRKKRLQDTDRKLIAKSLRDALI